MPNMTFYCSEKKNKRKDNKENRLNNLQQTLQVATISAELLSPARRGKYSQLQGVQFALQLS